MELRYKLNGIEIPEPIGMDEFEIQIKRSDEHGVGIENSVGELEFTGLEGKTITNAYNSDIDTEISFVIEVKCNQLDDWEELYSGVIDLTTYSKTETDYCSCSVKVAEIGQKTTFNNRTETAVDLDSTTGIDGSILSGKNNLKAKYLVPKKDYKKIARMQIDDICPSSSYDGYGSYFLTAPFGFNTIQEVEGTRESNAVELYANDKYSFLVPSTSTSNPKISVKSNIYVLPDSSAIDAISGIWFKISINNTTNIVHEQYLGFPLFSGSNFSAKFEGNIDVYPGDKIIAYYYIQSATHKKFHINPVEGSFFEIRINEQAEGDVYTELYYPQPSLDRVIESISGLRLKSDYFNKYDDRDNYVETDVSMLAFGYVNDLSWRMNTTVTDKLNLDSRLKSVGGVSKDITITRLGGSIDLSVSSATQTEIQFDSVDRLSQLIEPGWQIVAINGVEDSGYTVESVDGGMSIAVFTEILPILNYGDIVSFKPVTGDSGLVEFSEAPQVGIFEQDTECIFSVNQQQNTPSFGGGALLGLCNGRILRNTADKTFKSSFKELYQGLDAMFGLGWGFSKEGSKTVVRIEKFNWFYQDIKILEITDYNKKTIKFNASKAYSVLNIGYDKYAEAGENNTIDSYHTERSYTTKIKAFDKKADVKCKFIADPYIIETVRRESMNADSTTNTYDENIIVFALRYRKTSPTDWVYAIDNFYDDIVSFENIYGTNDINALLTPARNAMRYAGKINFAGKQTLYFNDGKVNYIAGIQKNDRGDIDSTPPVGNYYFQIEDPAVYRMLRENEDLAIENNILKPEIITLEYPLKKSEYEVIKSNPYGYVLLDGEKCFISEIKWSPIDGLANFTLIPKA